MIKYDKTTVKNVTKKAKEKDKRALISKQQEEKLKELEYLLKCASAECGW